MISSSGKDTVITFHGVLKNLDFDQVYRLKDSRVDKQSGCIEYATRSWDCDPCGLAPTKLKSFELLDLVAELSHVKILFCPRSFRHQYAHARFLIALDPAPVSVHRLT